MMDLNLSDKVVIVTGGARGIGLAISKLLIEQEAIVVIAGRDELDNKKAVKELTRNGGRAFQIVSELTDPKACKKAVEETLAVYGRLDGLINNAGHNDGIGVEDGCYEKFITSLHRNLVHYYLMAHFSVPHLKKTKGGIVNISSKTAETGQGGTSGYAAANGGRNALTREWAVELLKYGIRVNAVIVAECWTPQYETWVKQFDDHLSKLEEIESRIPLEKRMTTPEEIANMVVFLLSEKSSHTTGQLIHVDGGYVHLDRSLLGQ